MAETSGYGSSNVTVGAEPDQGSVSRLETIIENALAKGFEKGMDRLGQVITQSSRLKSQMKSLQDAAAKALDPKRFAAATEGLTDSQKAVARLVKSFEQLGVKQTSILKEQQRGIVELGRTLRIQAENEISERQKIVKDKAAAIVSDQATRNRENLQIKADLNSRLQTERATLDQAGRAQREAAQKAVIDHSTASRQRVAITRAMIDQIQRLERGIGNLISGTVKTGVSAISRTSSAIGGGLASIFRREASDIGSTNTILRKSLSERETVMRSSFTKQERLIRESATRQEAQFTKLRTISSKGVAGAVTGRGIGGGLGGLAGIAGGIGFAGLLGQGFTSATNLTEQINKNKVVFGDFREWVLQWSKTSVTALGVTRDKALEAAGTFGNLFRAIGLSENQSAEFSISLTNLATDLASFNNSSPEEAFEAIRSGLVGEQEPLRKFGVNLNDVTLKAKAMQLGLYNGKGVLDANAKAQAAYALILEQTSLAQGDFARTAHEGANAQRVAKAAIQQTFAALAGLLKGFVTTIANEAVPVFNTLTNLITGENLSKGLTVLRDGIKGVGVALGVLLAAKAGVEVIQLLGAAAKLALTPFGALAVAMTAIGATIAILMPRSKEFSDTIHEWLGRAEDFAASIKARVVPILETFAHWITESAIPAVASFIGWVGTKLVAAYRISVEFVQTKVIPALKAFAGWIVDHVVPAAVSFGQTVSRWFGIGLEKVQEFWHFVQPFIAPAIAGFKALGSAVAAIFKGDFSKILGGLGSAATGLGKTFANIGVAVFNALKPIGGKVLDWLKGVFSGHNLDILVGGFLDFVEAVGRFIGTHADVIIESLAKVFAAAAVVAFRFAKGFVDGLKKSLPVLLGDLWDILKSVFATAGEALLHALFNPSIWLKAILAVTAYQVLLKPIISAFSQGGVQAGKSFATGLRSSVAGTLQGLFGPSAVGGANANAAQSALLKEARDVQNQLRILGSGTIVDPTTRNGIRNARAEVKQLSNGISEAQMRGLQFRDTVRGLGSAITTAFKGGAGLVAGLANREDLSQIKTRFKTLTSDLRKIIGEQGGWAAVGKTIGRGLALGALGAVSGFMAGKAEGQAGGSGILSALGTGLGLGLAVGGPAGVVVGTVAAGASLIGAAFGRADKAASDFREKVKTLAAAIKTDLGDAVKAGAVGVLDLRSALAGGAEGALGQGILDSLADPLRADLLKHGISTSDLLSAFAGGQGAVDALTRQFGDNLAAVKLITDAYKEAKGAVDAFNLATQEARLARSQLGNEHVGLLNTVTKFAAGGAGFSGGQGSIPVIPTTTFQALQAKPDTGPVVRAILTVQTQIDNLTTAIGLASTALAGLFHPATPQTTGSDILSGAIVASSGLGKQVQDAVVQGMTDGATPGAVALSNAMKTTLEGQFGDTLASAITNAAKAGLVTDPATALTFAQPLLDAVLDGVTDPKIQDEFRNILNDAVNDVNFSSLTEKLRAATLKVDFVATFTGPDAKNQVSDSIQGFLPRGLPTTLHAEGKSIGVKFGQGVSAGLRDPDTRAQIAHAAQEIADMIPKVVKDIGKIRSPSQVMIDIGKNFGAGLALGLQDSTSDIGSVISNAIDAAIDKAKSAADRGREALRGAFSGLFGRATGSGAETNPLALSGAVGGFTSAFSSFLSASESNLGQLASLAEHQAALAKHIAGTAPLSASELDIAGENPFSLNPADVLGVANLGALTQTLDSIKAIGDALLNSGVSPADVAKSLSSYVDQLVWQATALGYSTDGIRDLADQLGLSNSALDAFVNAAATAANAMAEAQAAAQAIAQAYSYTPGALTGNATSDLAAAEALGLPIPQDLLASLTTSQIVAYLNRHPDVLAALGIAGITPLDAARLIQSMYGYEPTDTSNQSDGMGNNGRGGDGGDGGDAGENHTENLPTIGTNNFFITAPTADPAALALAVANHLASSAYVP